MSLACGIVCADEENVAVEVKLSSVNLPGTSKVRGT